MFNGIIGRATPGYTVNEEKGKIYIDGLRIAWFVAAIRNYYNTVRIEKYLFKSCARTRIVIHSFYALELLFIINQMIEDKDKRFSNHIDKRTLYIIRGKLIDNTWLKDTRKEYPDIFDRTKLADMQKVPKDFQLRFYDEFSQAVQQLGLRGTILEGTPGSGKTFMALSMTHMLPKACTIVIAPGNAVENVWGRSIRMGNDDSLFKVPKTYWSTEEHDFETLHFDTDYVIVHYEALEKLFVRLTKIKPKCTLYIVNDESHNFNEIDSKRTRCLIDLVEFAKPKYFIPLSGTPIKAMHAEAIPLFRCIDPRFTEAAAENFAKIYGIQHSAATEILQHRIQRVKYVVTKDQLGIEKADIRYIQVKVPHYTPFLLSTLVEDMRDHYAKRMDDFTKNEHRYREVYDRYVAMYVARHGENNQGYAKYVRYVKTISSSKNAFGLDKEMTVYCNWFENTQIKPLIKTPQERAEFNSVKSIVKYPHLKARGECLALLGQARIKAEIEIAKTFDINAAMGLTCKKTVFFTSYVDVIEIFIKRCQEESINGCFVYAATNSHLTDIIRAFYEEEEVNPLFATMKSLSTAVPLTIADHMVLIGVPFRDYELQQVISRINRLGATTVSIVEICALDTGEEPNITTRTIDILKWSQEQMTAITGTDTPFAIEDIEDGGFSKEGATNFIEHEIIF